LPCHNLRGRQSREKVGGSRTYHLTRRYGITAAEADAMFAAQDGVCAVCRAAPAVHVDHDHRDGRVRALLCFNCNGGLGQFRDDPDVLRAAAEYVEFHRERPPDVGPAALAMNSSMGRRAPVVPPVGSGRRRRVRLPADRLCSRTLMALAIEAETREADA
jgi:hypothetical protein